MALAAEAAKPTISAHIALRIAISDPASTPFRFASRQAPLLHVNSRSRVGGTGVARNFNKRDRRNVREDRDSRADRDRRQGCNRDSRRSREIFPKRWPDTAHNS